MKIRDCALVHAISIDGYPGSHQHLNAVEDKLSITEDPKGLVVSVPGQETETLIPSHNVKYLRRFTEAKKAAK